MPTSNYSYDFSKYNLKELTLVLEAVTERMAEFNDPAVNVRDKFGWIGDTVSHPDMGFGTIREFAPESEMILVRFDGIKTPVWCDLDDLVNKDS